MGKSTEGEGEIFERRLSSNGIIPDSKRPLCSRLFARKSIDERIEELQIADGIRLNNIQMDQEIFDEEEEKEENLEVIEEIREKNESLDTNPFDNSDSENENDKCEENEKDENGNPFGSNDENEENESDCTNPFGPVAEDEI